MSKFLRVALVVLVGCSTGVLAAADAGVRLAVGPFFFPGTRPELQEDSRLLRELMLTSLSATDGIELVEREKVNRICDELNLTSAGLVNREHATRLGQLLGCERVLSGSLSMVDGRRHLWAKLIDVRNGVILDIRPAFYEPGRLPDVAAAMARHIGATGTNSRRSEFVALGPFMDMTSPTESRREDWSRRLAALVEQQLLDAGVGVVELEAVGALFEERRLQDGGLVRTSDRDDPRVRIQPAFWLVDGGAGWVAGKDGVLAVGLRVQQVGGPEQRFWLTNTVGPALEAGIREVLGTAWRNTNRVGGVTVNAEPDLFAARAREMEFRRNPFMPVVGSPKTRWDQYKQIRDDFLKVGERQHAVNMGYQRTLLQDPNNHHAKLQLAQAYLFEPGETHWSEGVAMLRELAAGAPPEFADPARGHLANLELFRQVARSGPSKPVRPTDWQSIKQAYAEEPEDPEAQFDFASHVVAARDGNLRQLGRKILRGLVASGGEPFAERARQTLADAERIEEHLQATAREEAWVEFLQKNAARFAETRPARAASGAATLHRLPVRTSALWHEGRRYFGYRFAVPADLDGDLRWLFVIERAQAGKDVDVSDLEWGLIAGRGSLKSGLSEPKVLTLEQHPELRRQFPLTQTAITQTVARRSLEPGREYLLWFASNNPDLPDLALALTIDSEASRRLYGSLPAE